LDRLESMSVLLATVEFGSLSAASRVLGIPLTSVSRKISELERHLNAQLLNRSSRRLVLTEAGRSHVTACRRILEEIKEAERGASGEYRTPQGDLTVTAPIVFGRLHVLPVAIGVLVNRWPFMAALTRRGCQLRRRAENKLCQSQKFLLCANSNFWPHEIG
jgi:DNA-binding transcriptional LysR family regulator